MYEKPKEKELRGLFINKARKKARPIVEKKRAELAKEGKKLSRKEENKIIRKVSNKIKKEYAVRGFFAAIGLSAGLSLGISGTKLLDAAQNKGITQDEKSITIDAIEAGKDVYIQNDDKDNKYTKRDIFLNGNRVDLNKQTNQIKENVTEEIETLENKNDILNYVKDIYVEEYNEKNETQLTNKDISISKRIFSVNIKRDKAENGDAILRKSSEGTSEYLKGLYTIKIKTANGTEFQQISRDEMTNKKLRVYDENEKVERYTENEATKLADIIMSGTDYAIALDEKDTSISTKNEYKERFINSIVKNKKEKVNKIVEEKLNRNTNDNDKRIVEER